MLCQHFPAPRGGGEELVQGQQTWPKRGNISFHTHTPHPAEPLGGKVRKDSEIAAPPPIISLSLAQPPKSRLFWEKHLLFQFPPLPPAGDQRHRGSETKRQRQRQGTGTQRQPKETDRARHDQRLYQQPFHPPAQNQGGRGRTPRS